MDRTIRSALALLAAVALSAFAGTDISAQTIAAGDAQGYLGSWDLPIEAGQPGTLLIEIWDNGGQVEGAVSRPEGTATLVRRITKLDEAIVLEYTADHLQGQQAPIEIRLVQEGADLHATVRVADGRMTLDGTATPRE